MREKNLWSSQFLVVTVDTQPEIDLQHDSYDRVGAIFVVFVREIVDCSDANQDNKDNFGPQVNSDPVCTTLHRSEEQQKVD